MPERPVDHAQFTIERVYDAAPATVMAAWADAEARKRWGPPSPKVALVYDEAEFHVGGHDVGRCGRPDDLAYRVEAHYQDIVPGRRIVFVETVEGRRARLSVSLITVEFKPEDAGTRLRLTAQVAALAGADMIEENKAGWTAALGNLAGFLVLAPMSSRTQRNVRRREPCASW